MAGSSAGPVIELDGVTKAYRTRAGVTRAVDDLTVSIPRGGVHGLLGPNGSGKTTTIRMLLGLVAADSGRVRVLGAPIPTQLASVVGSVGALVESPQLFPGFTGRRNLEILARLGGVPTPRIDRLLDLVQLRERADDRVKGYSLGMRQRLAIAAAMLKDPDLLILDEPTNGLDPAGMVEIRDLISQLGSDGHSTVILSSHLLAEVEAVCDAVTILRRGALVATGSVAEVMARAGVTTGLTVRVAGDPAAAVAALAAAGIGARPAPDGLVQVDSDDGARVNWALATGGLWASEISPGRRDLERVFLDLTQAESSGEES